MAFQQTPYPQQTSSSYYTGGGYPGTPYTETSKSFPNAASFTGVQAGMMHSGLGGYGTNGSNGNLIFSDKTIRNGFIRKVYLILMCQISVTAAFIAFFVYKENLKLFARNNPGLLMLSFITTIICLFAMSCFESARRTAPINYIFLFVFTLAESFMLGVISSFYHAEEVMLAVGLCAVVCFGLTVFSFQTKIDFTMMGGILFVAVLVLIVFGFVAMFWTSMRLVYACLGTLLFSVYLIYDTQMMIGGEHKYSISPEEYVFAALTLYIDIINIFLYILSIIGSRD